MDKRQAVEFLEYLRQDRNLERTIYGDALNMAIDALKAQLFSEGTTSDTISRQAAIDALDVLCQEHRYRIPGKRETYSEYNEAWQDALDRAERLIFNLPTVPQERKKGKWIGTEFDGYADGNPVFCEWQCSECGCIFEDEEPTYNYCPNCGARMKGEQDGH